jgi:hypothetical protein
VVVATSSTIGRLSEAPTFHSRLAGSAGGAERAMITAFGLHGTPPSTEISISSQALYLKPPPLIGSASSGSKPTLTDLITSALASPQYSSAFAEMPGGAKVISALTFSGVIVISALPIGLVGS